MDDIVTRAQEEEYFINLIQNTTQCFLHDEDLHAARIKVINAFEFGKGSRFRDIDFAMEKNRLAFFIRQGPVSTGVANYMISKALVENAGDILPPETTEEEVKVIDLGARHGCATVGLCSALNAYLRGKRVQLTLVDRQREWEEIFDGMKNLLLAGDFGNASQFFEKNYVNVKYECCDLKHPEYNENFKRYLNEADILLLSRVLNTVDVKDIDIIARKIVEEMKSGSVLIFIDCIENYYGRPYPRIFEELDEIFSIREEDNSEYNFFGTIEKDFKVSKTTMAKIFVFKKN